MASIEQRSFHQIGTVSNRLSKFVRPLFDRIFDRVLPPSQGVNMNWEGHADWAIIQQEPLRARYLLRSIVLVFTLLLVWAAFAYVDEVTRGDAKVIPTSQLKIVQSVDGGVVEEIAVREGQLVNANDLLLRIDPTRFVSSMQENRAQYLSYQAKAARLQALTEGTELVFPPEVLEEAPDVAEHEQRLYQSMLGEMKAQLSIAEDQLTQRRQELQEMQSRYNQANERLRLTTQEYNATKPLVASGAVSEIDILRLDRDLSSLRGERDQAAAQMGRIRATITEASRKIEEVVLNSRNTMRRDLSETMSNLATLSESGRGLADRVKHAEIRSPVRGTVQRVLVNTIGGVVQPGKEVVEIVPLDDSLVLEAKIQPKDIAFLRAGQPALVKFTAYDYSIYGGLEAEVEQIGADTVTDDKGNAFYIIRVRTHEASLGKDLPIISGMVAEVDILTGKKTVLSYLLKPVLRAKAGALSER